MLLSIEGDEATRKTTMAYTAPKPCVGFNFDIGEERALYGAGYTHYFEDKKINIVKYKKGSVPKAQWAGNDITIYELPRPIQLEDSQLEGMIELWDYFIALFGESASDENVQSIIVDTATAARRIKADAHLQKLQRDKPRVQLIQIEYGVVNGAIESLYDYCKAIDKNLIMVHHRTDERVDKVMPDGSVKEGMLTGNKVIEGWNKTYNKVDVAVTTEKNSPNVKARITKCGYNLALEGNTLVPEWDVLVTMISDSINGRLNL